MAKIVVTTGPKGEENGFMFFCPGCKCGHIFNTKETELWKFNKDMEKPTLFPSYLTGHNNFTKNLCHSYIKDGMIQFLEDCYHGLKGKTVPLEDFK